MGNFSTQLKVSAVAIPIMNRPFIPKVRSPLSHPKSHAGDRLFSPKVRSLFPIPINIKLKYFQLQHSTHPAFRNLLLHHLLATFHNSQILQTNQRNVSVHLIHPQHKKE